MDGAGKTLKAGSERPKRRRNLGQLRRLVHYAGAYRWRVAGTLLALIVAAGSVLVFGAGIRHLIDAGVSGGDPEALGHALKASIIVISVLALATYARSYLVTWIGERVVADLRKDVFGHVVRLSPGFFEVTRTGEVLSRLTADTSVVQAVVASSLSQALRNIILVLGGFVLLLITNPKLTGLVLIVVPLVVIPIVVIGRRVRQLSRVAQDQVGALGGHGEETLNAVRTVQAYAQEGRETAAFATLSERAFAAATDHARARARLGAIVIGLVFGAIIAVLYVGGRDVIAGEITGGELAAFIFYAIIVASSAGGLSEIMGDLQRAAGATERLFQLLEQEPAIAAPAVPTPLPEPLRGALRLENLTFAYPSRPSHDVLAGVDLDIAPGETVALVGPSGAGKSSIFQLLMRFYDAQTGRILFDGVDLRDLEPEAFRSRIGLVPQEPVIFSADAWTNLRYGRPDATDEAVLAAARAAHALEFLEALPDGLSTFVGEKGVRLSGGQRQRVAIARALLKDPTVLLLDEATSSLDAESEQLVQVALERLMQGRTSLVIAHRLSTVLRADRIVVLEHGRAVAMGTHHELMEQDGLYARLAELQFDVDRRLAAAE